MQLMITFVHKFPVLALSSLSFQRRQRPTNAKSQCPPIHLPGRDFPSPSPAPPLLLRLASAGMLHKLHAYAKAGC